MNQGNKKINNNSGSTWSKTSTKILLNTVLLCIIFTPIVLILLEEDPKVLFILGMFLLWKFSLSDFVFYKKGTETQKRTLEPEDTSIDIYSKLVPYIRIKQKLIQDIENLEKLLKNDIQHIGTNYKDIHTTSLLIEGFGKSISLATDALIDILPEDTSIISEFDIREEFYLYLDALLHEMDWIKKSSFEMQKQVQSWMVYHHIEVRGERQKLEQLLKEGDNKLTESMGALLTLSRTLREEGEEKTVEEMLVRQKI